jgi:hypothetical protein
VDGAEIEAPWLLSGGTLLVNGVDVVPFVEAELNRRFPGRGEVLEEEWEHHRYAVRDLDAIEATSEGR